MTSQFNVCPSITNEVFAVIFDDSVYLHSVEETHEAPGISFASVEIFLHAIITVSYTHLTLPTTPYV